MTYNKDGFQMEMDWDKDVEMPKKSDSVANGTLAHDIHEFIDQAEKLKQIFIQLPETERAAVIDTIKQAQSICVKLIPRNFGMLIDPGSPVKANPMMDDPPHSTLEGKFRRRWVGGKYVDERIQNTPE
jgi:hypothetical protein